MAKERNRLRGTQDEVFRPIVPPKIAIWSHLQKAEQRLSRLPSASVRPATLALAGSQSVVMEDLEPLRESAGRAAVVLLKTGQTQLAGTLARRLDQLITEITSGEPKK